MADKAARVALVAVDSKWQDPAGTFLSFSYGIEKLRASLRGSPEFDDVELLLLDLRTSDPQEYFDRLIEFRPTLVGLSLFVWSMGIFRDLTAALRRWDPSVVVVAGGPAARRSALDLAPYRPLRDQLDAVIPGEGEGTIRELVRHHQSPDWRQRIRGLDLPGRGLWRTTGAEERPEIDLYPSPYQLGLAPRAKTGYIETFRGCPIHCSFCQWGEQKSDRVHGEDYLRSHLEGLKRAEITNAFFLDAAFNLNGRAFRNLVAAEREVGALTDKVIHGHLYPTHLKEHHLEFFERCGHTQASIGIQSFDPEVLHRLGRPFDVDRFTQVLTMLRGRLPIDIELIFGLPGDNPESFRRTLERSMALGDTVKIFRCLVLPDALLDRADPDFHIDFDPATFELRSCAGWSREAFEEEWAWVTKLAEGMNRPVLNDDWVGFNTSEPTPRSLSRRAAVIDDAGPEELNGVSREGAGRASKVPDLPEGSIERLRRAIPTKVAGWRLRSVRSEAEGLLFDLDGPEGSVILEVVSSIPGQRSFAVRDGLAYSHRGPLGRAHATSLRQVIDLVHADARPMFRAS